MPRRLLLIPAALVATTLALAGCSSSSPGSSGSSGGKLEVLASFYPLQFVAERVGGDLVNVKNLTPPAAEPHDLELSPAQVRAMGDAALVVYESGFQPAVDDAVKERKPAHVVDATKYVHLEEHPNGEGVAATAESELDHADEDGGTEDPHFWLDPTRLPPVADAVADQLAKVDPAHADTYRANAKALDSDLTALDSEFATELKPCAGATLVTSHEAFGYLAERYDLDQVGVSGIDPDADPSPARVKEVGQIVKDTGVTTIYFEKLVSPKVVQTLASDLGVKATVLDPLESLSDSSSDYLGVMHANLKALTGGLTCS